MIQLTGHSGKKFYLNANLIETISEVRDGTSEITLTSGRRVTCMESPDKIAEMVNKL